MVITCQQYNLAAAAEAGLIIHGFRHRQLEVCFVPLNTIALHNPH